MRPFSQEHCRGKHVALRVFQPQSRFNDLDDWHFSDIAAPIGGVGERVTTRREFAATRLRCQATRAVFAGRGGAAAWRDLARAGALRLRLQIRP
jgi:hypothetical protein